MCADVTIRRAVPADAARLHELVNNSYRGSGNWTHEQDLVGGPRLTLQQAQQLLAAQHSAESSEHAHASVVLVAVLAAPAGGLETGTLVGCIEAPTSDTNLAAPDEPPDGYLGLLAVDSRVGSLGIGRALVCEGEATCQSVFGSRAIVLYVLSVRHDIQQWYLRRGYCLSGLSVPAAPLISSISPDSRLLVDHAEFLVLRRALADKDAAPAQH